MPGPSVATVKLLYAVAGNQCAFPKCSVPLVEKTSGTLTGRICHITASRPGGPRYNPRQTDEERNAFENLVLMCPIHHDVIDADPEAYTVTRLKALKAAHEVANAGGPEPDDRVATQLLAEIDSATLIHGSIIFTHNQAGGQVAHSITNVGPQPRTISAPAANLLVAQLRRLPPEPYQVTLPMGDGEAQRLATALDETLKLAGWESRGVLPFVACDPPAYDVTVSTPVEKPALVALFRWLESAGLKPTGTLSKDAEHTDITVGYRT